MRKQAREWGRRTVGSKRRDATNLSGDDTLTSQEIVPMRIVRPYGRSAIRQDDRGRFLIERSERAREHSINEFAGSHDELVIAQWISTIDKIATKPTGNRKPTEVQRDLRRRLGDAAWQQLLKRGLLPGLAGDDSRAQELKELWKFKVEPYPQGNSPTRGGNRSRPEPNPKGRWYKRFAGTVEPYEVNATEVAEKIYEHLHQGEYRITDGRPSKRSGLLDARASSITGNLLKRDLPGRGGSPWNEDDKVAYEAAGNVAAEIRKKAEEMEKWGNSGTGKARPQSVFMRDLGPVLFEHYGRLFDDGQGPLSIKEAKSCKPGLLALHEAVKDVYRRRLSGHKSIKHKSVSGTLPASMDALFALVDQMRANRDLNALVRLGKVIHYEAGVAEGRGVIGAVTDAPIHVVSHWPEDVSASRYWTTDGQAEIKRNEVFVRLWRHVLALAARTLTDWADPEGKQTRDILGTAPIKAVTGEDFCPDSYSRKSRLLFGESARFFESGSAGNVANGDFQKQVLKLALDSVASLRNGSFHFNGLGGFVLALESLGNEAGSEVRHALGKLWQTDHEGRAEQLRQTMRAAHSEHFFDETQNRQLYGAIWRAMSNPDAADVPLPRFNRLLRRAWNIRDDAGSAPKFPEPANRSGLDDPARLCQYTAMKLVYEQPFRDWLAKRPASELNDFIGKAVARATAAARKMNARQYDEGGTGVIRAKAEKLGKLGDGETIRHFLSRLSAETASEMRVQRGYDSDPDNARDQAGYIDALGLDVIGLAFDRYLEEAHFGFLRSLPSEEPNLPETQFNLDSMTGALPPTDAEGWQPVLYFLIHLVPVDDIARLRHQMRKWEILAGGSEGGESDKQPDGPMMDRVRRVQVVLDLYLDMHDAKFSGSSALTGIDDFREFFRCGDSFDRIFPQQPGDRDDGRIPRRGFTRNHAVRTFVTFAGHLREVSDYEGTSPGLRTGRRTEQRRQVHRRASAAGA